MVERLLAAQAQFTIQNRIERRIKESKLPQRKLLADFDFDFQKGLDKAQIMQLADLSFVKRKQGLILAGGSGVGKSHIAQALLLMGCQKTIPRSLHHGRGYAQRPPGRTIGRHFGAKNSKNTLAPTYYLLMKSVLIDWNRNPLETPPFSLR